MNLNVPPPKAKPFGKPGVGGVSPTANQPKKPPIKQPTNTGKAHKPQYL